MKYTKILRGAIFQTESEIFLVFFSTQNTEGKTIFKINSYLAAKIIIQ
jgi:hypothetical protein